MSIGNKNLKMVSIAITAIVFIEELSYFFGHRRTGPSLAIALLALAVAFLAISCLMQDRK